MSVTGDTPMEGDRFMIGKIVGMSVVKFLVWPDKDFAVPPLALNHSKFLFFKDKTKSECAKTEFLFVLSKDIFIAKR